MVHCTVIGCKLKQNANEGCDSCASLAGLVLSFIACFILLVIVPLEPWLDAPTIPPLLFHTGFAAGQQIIESVNGLCMFSGVLFIRRS